MKDFELINFPDYANLYNPEVVLADMGDMVITSTISIPRDIVPDFSYDWALKFRGEKYIQPFRVVQGIDDSSSIYTSYTLSFYHEPSYRLKTEYYVDVYLYGATNTPIINSYNASKNLNLGDFVEDFNKVLNFYFDGTIVMDLNPSYAYDLSPVAITADNAYIWDILQEFQSLFDVRWYWETIGDIAYIKVGYVIPDISHIFEYGFKGGLLKFERQVQDPSIKNKLIVMGGTENLPYRYFKDIDPLNPSFPADPDWIPELSNKYFEGLMPSEFRDYVQGWKSKSGVPEVGRSDAYYKGFNDTRFHPVDYVQDLDSISKYGVRPEVLSAQEDLIPSIQGVSIDGIGRVDELVGIEQVLTDTPPSDSYSEDVIQGASYTLPDGGSTTHNFSVKGNYMTLKDVISLKFVLSAQYNSSSGIEITSSQVKLLPISIGESVGDIVLGDIQNGMNKATQEVEITNIPDGTYYIQAILGTKILGYGEYSITGAIGDITVLSKDTEGFKQTFDIWIKNLFQTTKRDDETPNDYKERIWDPLLTDDTFQVSFSSGRLSAADYSFNVISINYDTSKNNSEWRLTLEKSTSEAEAGVPFIPTKEFNAELGDFFYFLGITLPHQYILWGEAKVSQYGYDALDEVAEVSPTWVVNTDPIRVQEVTENDVKLFSKLIVGARFRARNKRLVSADESWISLYISTLTLRYGGAMLPEMDIVVTDNPLTSISPVEAVSAEIKSLSTQIAGISNVEKLIQSIGDKLYLRKDGIPQQSSSDTSFGNNIQSNGAAKGQIGGKGWLMYQDGNGNSVFETDIVNVRKDMNVNNLVVNQVTAIGGKQIKSAARIEVSRVDISEDGYICYFEQKQGSIGNLFKLDDVAYSSVWDSSEIETKFYKRKVIGIGINYILLSKTETNGNGVPEIGDVICHYGNYTDANRQYVIIEDVVGGGYERMLKGLDSVNSNGIEYFFAGRIQGDTERFFVGDSNEYIEYKDGVLSVKGKLIIKGSSGGESTVEDELDSLENKNLELSEDLEDYKSIMNSNLAQINSSITGLQNTQDKMIVGHSGEEVPTLTNAPANEWNTTALLKEHEFDIYDRIEVQQDGTLKVVDSYKFMHLGDSYAWVLQSNSESAANRVLAEQAYNLAGIKATIFYKNTHPNAPYAENDVWIDVDNGVMYLAKFDRPEGQVGLESDWLAVIDAQLRLSNLANDGIISKEEKPQYRDILAQVTQEMVKFREDAETYSVDISALESAFGTFETQNISVYKVNVDSDTSVTAAQRTAYNVAFADYQTEKMHFANAIAEKITSIQIAMLNVAGENILDDSRLLKLNPYNTGRGTSVLIDNESEEAFYRSTPSSGLSVSMYTFKTFSYKDLDIQGISLGENMIDSIYVRHFHTEAVTFRAVTNPAVSPIVVYPSKWTQIYFLRTAVDNYRPSGIGVYNAEGTAEVIDLPIDYKKQAVRRGNLVVDWSPSIADTFDSVNDAIDLAAAVDGKVDQLDNSINDALKDGSLDAIEKASIVEQLKVIETLFDEKESSYNIVYNNGYLEGEAKTLLQSAMADLYSRKVSLSSAINNLVNATTITDTLRLAYSTAYSNFDSAVAYYQTRLEAANKAIQTKLDALAQEHTDFLQQVISSKGDQLIENGSLLLGSNYGFPNTEFSGEAYNGSAGSLTRANTARYHIIGTQNIPLDTSKEWLLSGAFKSENGLTRSYAGLMMYDIDGTTIQAYEHMYIKDTLTTLAQPLEDGDTVVYFDDLENWIDSSFTYQRGFIFWNYTNSKGYTYPELTYSKNVWSNIYQNSGINKSMNRITLSSPWTGGTIPAGTKVSQSNNGNTYKYSLLNNTLIPTEWEDFKGVISGIDYTGTNDTLKFAPGTAFVKLFILWNWNQANDQMWATNLFLKNNIEGLIEPLKDITEQLETNLQLLDDSIDDALKDGTLNALEKAAITQIIKVIEGLYSEKTSAYNSLASNPLIEGSSELDGLTAAKIALDSRKNELDLAISNLLNAAPITQAIETAYDTAYQNFNTQIAYFQKLLEDINTTLIDASIVDIKEDISDIFSDGQATPDEKIRLKGRLDSVTNIHNTNKAAAQDLGIAIGMYDSAFGNLNAVLSSVLTNMEITSTANLSNIESLFAAWELQNSLIVQAISEGNGVEGGTKAKEDLAIQMGYTSYEEMVQKYDQQETLIKGGRINTGLIEAEAIVAEQINTQGLVAPNIQTAVSGERVEITQEQRGMSAYDENGDLMLKVHGKDLSDFNSTTVNVTLTPRQGTESMPAGTPEYHDDVILPLGTFNVINPSNEIIIPATTISLTAGITYGDIVGMRAIYRIGSLILGVVEQSVTALSTKVLVVPEFKTSMAVGVHKLEVEYIFNMVRNDVSLPSPTATIQITFSTNTAQIIYINKLFEIATSGIRFASDEARWLGFFRNGLDILLAAKGITVDLPGYLASYTVPENGGAALVAHGPKSRTDLAPIKLGSGSTLKYRVYHSIGHTKYVAIGTAYSEGGAARIFHILDNYPTYIEVMFEDTNSTPQACKFNIVFYGEN